MSGKLKKWCVPKLTITEFKSDLCSSINLNAQHVNGITPLDFAVRSV